MDNLPMVYTIDEIAGILKLTRRTVYSYVKDGRLRAAKIGKEYRITETALKDFLNEPQPTATAAI